LIGKRRINRKNNGIGFLKDNFVGHSLASKFNRESRDSLPGHPPQQIPGPFTTEMEKSLFSISQVENKASKDELLICGTRILTAGPLRLSKNDKRLRHHVRRYNCDYPLLESFENEILRFIKTNFETEQDYELNVAEDSDLESDHSFEAGWVALRPMQMTNEIRMQVSNSFLRILVHSMCRYYALISFSEDLEDNRVTVIRLPELNGRKYEFPALKFADFLLN
jgi:hypothetical protein